MNGAGTNVHEYRDHHLIRYVNKAHPKEPLASIHSIEPDLCDQQTNSSQPGISPQSDAATFDTSVSSESASSAPALCSP
jgi:hypothetical protein